MSKKDSDEKIFSSASLRNKQLKNKTNTTKKYVEEVTNELEQ
jgi:hypothetical protein